MAAETIQGRKLFAEIRYVLFYPYSIFRRRSTSNVIENKKQEIVSKPSPLPYKPEFRKQATLTLITVDENTSRLINFNKLRDSPPPYEELEDISDSVSIPMPAATIGMCILHSILISILWYFVAHN